MQVGLMKRRQTITHFILTDTTLEVNKIVTEANSVIKSTDFSFDNNNKDLHDDVIHVPLYLAKVILYIRLVIQYQPQRIMETILYQTMTLQQLKGSILDDTGAINSTQPNEENQDVSQYHTILL